MTELEFYQGWATLTAMPYAHFLAKDPAKFQRLEASYKRVFLRYDGVPWAKAIDKYVSLGTVWPAIPDLVSLVKAYSVKPASRAVSTYQPVPEDYLPRLLFREAKVRNETVREAGLRLIPQWLVDHPHDPDRERAERLLESFQALEAPANPELGQMLRDAAHGA